ncbi:MAG: RdgB/HAM1 family non-canonical purine NTP pyrophosphatase [Gammaproteobacteria bacterium]|nr:RdgB/HAM1 family non-canonical purine NTP pyrophosphatase [Gammaproteobacteria bacterium]MDH3417264.1 RdgB/HAM1 family non-canonical purine NTP pyrophosphatase [Gammaproteobacteria bacterium]
MASGNAGKLREIARILGDLDINVVPQSEFGVAEADETGTTFVENALIKARHAVAATGLPAIADDSGLAVDALDGRPGVYSSRYAGPDATDQANIDKLLAALDGVPDEDRGAAFHCASCFVMPGDQEPIIAQGEWRGSILKEMQGDGGFGYDPVFFVSETRCSAAQMGDEEKNACSHRGKALKELARQLRTL